MAALVRSELERTLDEVATTQSTVNAFITIDAEGARSAGDRADLRRKADRGLGPLDGVMVAVKDGLDTAGLRTTFGAKVFQDRVPTADATSVRRLKSSGAIIVGKTNMTELACGTVGVNEHFGTVRNPLDLSRYPGGSSSGSAAAVAAGLVDIALGTDTACSIRHPAATCGIVGLKPTWGRIPNDGCCIGAVAVDHVGPMTRTVQQSADVLGALQDAPWGDATLKIGMDLDGVRVGVLGGEFVEQCSPDVVLAHEAALRRIERLGAKLIDVRLNIDLGAADDALNMLCIDLVEAYGDTLTAAPIGDVGEELLEWIKVFAAPGASELLEATALRVQSQLQVAELFTRVNAVLCPTARRTAGLLEEAVNEPREFRNGNCSIFSFSGVPSLTVPSGFGANDMPVGLLISAASGEDETALQIGHAFMTA